MTKSTNKSETILMRLHPNMVEEIISMLKHIDVDGETMEHILEAVGMQEQMLRQLTLNASASTLNHLIEERNQFKPF